MTAIFISHSSADYEASVKMKLWLEQQGHTSRSLDFDPETGIKAGSDWEETIYYKLRQCQAVLALLSPHWLASKWCFAELVQAREKGKVIFLIKVQPCDASHIFGDIQQIDLTTHADEGYARLAIGLKECGLDPRDVFDWDPMRPPYPGLLAFQEEDAAIFFGRGEEILNGLETLASLRRRGRGAPRLVLFLGASGSGKSSLVRAGLIPRLKKHPSEWLTVAPFRPQDDPLAELALAFADTFEELGHPLNWGDIHRELRAAAEGEPADGQVLLTLARELTIAAKQRESTVVLTIDQAEELFDYGSVEPATRCLRLLRAALEVSDQQLMTIATMRSDFLGEFQTHRALQDQAYDHDFRYWAIPIDPMPERSFVDIIRGPAQLAGLRLEDGLVDTMVSDTGTRDALPLLAFTLRRLYERYAEDGLLQIREYDALGRLEGSIRVEAERVLQDVNPSAQDLEELRTAFVPTLVRINAEGAYTRRHAFSEELTSRAQSLLKHFVDSRLLVRDRDKDGRETLEVAHEALFRTWPQLSDWLVEDQDKLRLLENIHRAAEEWAKGDQAADFLVHRDGRLEDAEVLVANQRFALSDHSVEKRYLEACLEAQRAREVQQWAEQERRTQDAERIAEEQKKVAAAQKKTVWRTRVGLVIALGFAAAAGWQFWQATQNEAKAIQQAAAVKAASVLAIARTVDDPLTATLILMEAQGLPTPVGGEDYALELAGRPIPKAVLNVQGSKVQSAAFSADGQHLVTMSKNGMARRWAVDGIGPPVEVAVDDSSRAPFSADDQYGVNVSKDGTARVSTTPDDREPLILEGPKERVYDPGQGPGGLIEGRWDVVREEFQQAVFSPDKRHVLTVSKDGMARLWAVGNIYAPVVLPDNVGQVSHAVFSQDGNRVLIVSAGVTARVWSTDGSDKPMPIKVDSTQTLSPQMNVALSPDGRRLLTVSNDGTARLWSTDNTKPPEVLKVYAGSITSAIFSSEGKHVLLASKEGTVRVSAVDDSSGHVVVEGHGEAIQSAIFSPDDKRVLTVSEDKTVRLWNAEGRGVSKVLKGEGSGNAIFSPDGKQVLFTALFSDSQVLATDGVGEPVSFDHAGNIFSEGGGHSIQSFVFSPDSKHIVSASEDGKARIWNADDRQPRELNSQTHSKLLHAIFSPDGKRVLTVSVGGTVRVWDADGSGKPVAVKGHGEPIQNAVFSPNGERLLTVSADGIARIWPQLPLTWSALLRYLRERTTICLTVDQRIFYLAEKHDAAESTFKACEHQFGR